MRNKKGFTLIELLVVIAIIALLLSVIVPSLKKAKDAAKSVICKSNLKQWGVVWKMYGDSYDAEFPYWRIPGKPNGWHRGAWINALRNFMAEDREKLLLCPSATERNTLEEGGAVTLAYVMGDGNNGPNVPPGTSGSEICSYGMNLWCANSGGDKEATCSQSQPRPRTYYWQTFPTIKSPSQVPLMADCKWRGGGPWTDSELHYRAPQVDPFEMPKVNANEEMANFMLPRHPRGRINMGFVDMHVDDVALQSMWSLKWHRQWDTGTKGILPKDLTGTSRDGIAAWWHNCN